MREKKYIISSLIVFLCLFLSACSNTQSPLLYGEWQMIDWNGDKPLIDIYYYFKYNGEYTDSRSDDITWNYQYLEPDSLILYHHGAYEERYKILTLSGDSLIIELYESLLHTEDNGKEVTTEYINSESQIFKFIRNNQ